MKALTKEIINATKYKPIHLVGEYGVGVVYRSKPSYTSRYDTEVMTFFSYKRHDERRVENGIKPSAAPDGFSFAPTFALINETDRVHRVFYSIGEFKVAKQKCVKL